MRSTLIASGFAIIFACFSLALIAKDERDSSRANIALNDSQVYGYDLGPAATSLERLTGREVTVEHVGKDRWLMRLEH
jgi:hypothetical protein